MINIGIVGASGYTGLELLRLLAMHPAANICVVTSNTEKGQAVNTVFPSLPGLSHLVFEAHDSDQLKSCELLFFATPHATAMYQVPEFLAQGCRVIDLSADFRIKDIAVWEQWYQVQHASPELLEKAVYGLPELNRVQIKNAHLIANPGCYATAVILALLPAINNTLIQTNDIIADVKSGVSGAGRGALLTTQFAEVAESFRAYNVSGHRHVPEIKQVLNDSHKGCKVDLTFVPHLVPMNRGIFATIYVKPIDLQATMQTHYDTFYEQEPFVDVLSGGSHLNTASVRATNQCQIAIHPSPAQGAPTVLLSVLDNLVKGAAGQAIQNMNLMFGLDETTGLCWPGLIP